VGRLGYRYRVGPTRCASIKGGTWATRKSNPRNREVNNFNSLKMDKGYKTHDKECGSQGAFGAKFSHHFGSIMVTGDRKL